METHPFYLHFKSLHEESKSYSGVDKANVDRYLNIKFRSGATHNSNRLRECMAYGLIESRYSARSAETRSCRKFRFCFRAKGAMLHLSEGFAIKCQLFSDF